MSTTPLPPILILGAGGHGRVVLDIIRQGGKFTPIGFLDNNPALHGRRVDGLPVLGGIDKLSESADSQRAPGFAERAPGFSPAGANSTVSAHIVNECAAGAGGSVAPTISRCSVEPANGRFSAVIAIGDNGVRRMIAETVEAAGVALPPIIHPSAQIATNVTIGRGVVIAAGALVCAHSQIGDYAILNTGCIVDHESMIGTAVHICPGVRLAGHVTLESGAFIGIGSTVIQNVRIGFEAIVGAGAVVTTDVDPMTTVVGVPARAIKDAPSADEFASLLKPTLKAAGDAWNRPMHGTGKGDTGGSTVKGATSHDATTRLTDKGATGCSSASANAAGVQNFERALAADLTTPRTAHIRNLHPLTTPEAALDPRDPMYVSGR